MNPNVNNSEKNSVFRIDFSFLPVYSKHSGIGYIQHWACSVSHAPVLY